MFIPPMLLQRREQIFDDPRYLFEPKIDGHRLLLSLQDGAVRLYTRHNNDVTAKYPELHVPPVDADSIVLDGELACVLPDGSICFESVMRRFMSNPGSTAAAELPVHYFVFDVLRLDGEDLRRLTLLDRKAILSGVLTNNNHFSRVIHVEGNGSALFGVIKKRRMEGVVAKLSRSLYVGKRSQSWLKIINYTYADVEVVGLRKSTFGWLVRHEERIVGVVELAVPAVHKRAMRGLAVGESGDYIRIQPVGIRVRFRNWTRAGMLRSPEFVELIG